MKILPKTLVLTVTAFILSLFVSCTAFASNYVEWELASDGRTLTGDGVAYELYGSFDDYDFGITGDTYVYEDDVTFGGYGYSVYSYEKGGDIVRLSGYEESTRVYATKEGAKILDGFFGGTNVHYRLWEDGADKASDIDYEVLVKPLTDYALGENLASISVQTLKNSYYCQEITMHDELYFFSYTIGAFYTDISTGEIYFINYQSLGNQHFDAEGNFSYRSGNVDMVKLDPETEKAVTEALQNSDYIYNEWEWEDSGIYYSEEEAITLTPLFYAGLIILGFVFPLPFLVIGIVFPRIKKFGRPKYWYVLTVSSGLWIIAAIAFTILIFTA